MRRLDFVLVAVALAGCGDVGCIIGLCSRHHRPQPDCLYTVSQDSTGQWVVEVDGFHCPPLTIDTTRVF
jgi:hypothetical protein